MGNCKFAEKYRKISAFFRADVGIGPYWMEETMKKSHKILLVLVLLVLVLAVIAASNLHIAKTQEAVGELLWKKLDLPQDAVITCAGDYTADAYTMLWFIIQNQDMTLYRAVDCRVLNNGGYWVKKIYTPSAYARDIVHVVWRYARDIVLINNFDCRSIVYRTSYDEEKTELSAGDIPYIFLLPQSGYFTCDFLDASGNSIR